MITDLFKSDEYWRTKICYSLSLGLFKNFYSVVNRIYYLIYLLIAYVLSVLLLQDINSIIVAIHLCIRITSTLLGTQWIVSWVNHLTYLNYLFSLPLLSHQNHLFFELETGKIILNVLLVYNKSILIKYIYIYIYTMKS